VPTTGGPVTEVLVLTSANPTLAAGPVTEILALTSANPKLTGGPVTEITADAFFTFTQEPVATTSKQAARPHLSTSRAVVKLGEVSGTPTTVAFGRGIYTAPAATSAVIVYATVTCLSAAGVTSPATISLTTNGLDVFSPQQAVGLTTANKVWIWPTGVGAARRIQPTDTLDFVVDVAAVATTQIVAVRVYGYEL